MREMMRTVRHAARSLARTPGFTIIAILTLIVGIGANTAIFSAVEAILLHPVPVHNADRVVYVSSYLSKTGTEINVLTPAEFQELADRHDLFASVGAYLTATVSVTGNGDATRVDAISTAGALFDVLGVKPFLGRLYDSTDIRANRRVAMLSYAYWLERTGGASGHSVIGSPITIDDSTYTIVGVLPRGLDLPHGVEIWTPRQLRPIPCAKLDRDRTDPLSHSCKFATTLARLRDGADLATVQSVAIALMAQWRRTMPQFYPKETEQSLRVKTLNSVIAGEMRPLLLLLFAASAFVLLIACVNVACLQLVRTSGRAREIALRAALGANRFTITSQVLAESAVIAFIGGAGGVLIGILIVDVMKRAATTLPVDPNTLHFNPLVAGFALGATLITTILCALSPVLRATRIEAGDVLRGGGGRNASTGHRRARFLSSAVVVQVAAALTLVAGCAVAVQSFARLSSIDPGFRTDGLITMRLMMPWDRYRGWAKVLAFEAELNARIAAIPGVRAIATTSAAPYDPQRNESWVRPATTAERAGMSGASITPFYNMISNNYFDVLGTRVVAGRAFDESDNARFHADSLMQVGSVIIDETLARQLFPDGNAVGKKLGPWEPMPTIVGVVRATREAQLASTGAGNLYYPGADFLKDRTLIIRTSLSKDAITPMLRAIVRSLDASVPVANIDAVQDDINHSISPRHLASNVLGAFAAVALLLAMLGIYGVLSYTMTQRRKEMGIRLALGAAPHEVLRYVVSGAARLASVGIAVGLIVFVIAGQYMQSLVYGISARDPVTIVGCALLLGALALLAAWIPARSAASLDPAQTLRAE